MKKYQVYRNIRKGAVIMGLPISLFALIMISVIGSLLVIIFSFGIIMILALLLFNIALYGALLHLAQRSGTTSLKKVFPQTISNKKIGMSSYNTHDGK